MPTNILQLPLISVAFETATNEDWRDGIAFFTAASVVGYAAPGNTGDGTITGASVQAGAYVGEYIVSLLGSSAFQVADPDGYPLGSGLVGVPFSRSGLVFTLQAGSSAFATGDTMVASVLPAPIDLTGISFRMMVRKAASAAIYLDASTDAGTIVNYDNSYPGANNATLALSGSFEV